jgi:hypothetical protein
VYDFQTPTTQPHTPHAHNGFVNGGQLYPSRPTTLRSSKVAPGESVAVHAPPNRSATTLAKAVPRPPPQWNAKLYVEKWPLVREAVVCHTLSSVALKDIVYGAELNSLVGNTTHPVGFAASPPHSCKQILAA